MSTVTILVAGKTTQNGAHAVARYPTVLIFGIFCPLAYYQPPITGKKQAAAHRCGLFGVKKRR